ncbi:aspartyl-phosphate phosphatase Spo0E family protein [Lucifera butyrica]|nr:aspartyl-phosphate phosphatase Spo0E family protein [Lucifera butyrica]
MWKEIEQLQEELHKIISKKGINSPDAIRASQEFRNKMREYNDLENPIEP